MLVSDISRALIAVPMKNKTSGLLAVELQKSINHDTLLLNERAGSMMVS